MRGARTSYLSFLLGILVLAYLSTFVIFAIIRILFGVSIQRLWWSGLRRLAFTPRDGIRVDIRGLRLSLHRPTFAQPTWLSFVVTELKVTVDVKLLGSKPKKRKTWSQWGNGSINKFQTPPRTPTKPSAVDETEAEPETDAEAEETRSRTWHRLTLIKDKIKRLHRQIQWIRLVDLVANSSSLVIIDVGSFQLANFTMAVDTRRKTVDRSRLFQHRQAESDLQRPAEWIFTSRSLLFCLEGDEANEILDHATLNIHGLLSQYKEGLRDASIALKLGRLSLPYDDLLLCNERMQNRRKAHSRRSTGSRDRENLFRDIMEELEKPGSQEEDIVQTVSDSKEFVSSILRGIQEIQFAVGFVGLSKQIRSRAVRKAKAPVYLNMSMKEVGVDVLRLDRGSPAHLMYFSRDDIAHQALVTAISISVGIDDGHDHPERLLYVPMVTATLKSTLPSKTIQLSGQKNVADRNTNILFANLVVTSPSIDLDPKHLPFILALLRSQQERPRFPQKKRQGHHLISKLLPKANVKISIHEPVVRVSLPCMELERRGNNEFDLLISAMSSMSLDVDSSHSDGGEFHYSLNSTFRITGHQLYYQTAGGDKHNLLLTDSLELKTQINASPDVSVVVAGNAQTFSVYMVRPEISEGVRQIVVQLRSDIFGRHENSPRMDKPTLLRRLPNWLGQVSLQGSDFNFEVAGIDETVSGHTRGTALHLDSWTADYTANRHEEALVRPHRRRAVSRSVGNDDVFLRPLSPTPSKKLYSDTDSRRLAIHTHGLEGFVIESAESWETVPFMSLPRFEIAFSTSTDHQGPLLHVNSYAKSFYINYSLYRHYAVGVATMVLRKTFTTAESLPTTPTFLADLSPFSPEPSTPPRSPHIRPEVVTIDFRAGLVQIKSIMPADPPLMLQIFSLEAGRHRWATPFLRARLLRLYVETPGLKNVWSRMISMRGVRTDYRQSRRKFGTGYVEDRSVDISTDAIRIAVPHLLVVHKVIDNIVNVVKTTEQLHHRFKTGTEEYILAKRPEGPKKVPKVSLRAQALLFEIEDGPFDWKLSLIYLQGLHEQKQRLAREEAFRLKVKKIEEQDAKVAASRFRAKSSHPGGRSRLRRKSTEAIDAGRSRSLEQEEPRRPRTPVDEGRRLRYNAEGFCGISETAKRTIKDARAALDQLNAQSWKKRINTAIRHQKTGMQDIRHMVWGLDEIPEDADQHENIMAIPQRPSLMSVLISDLHIQVDKPKFALHDYPTFMNKMGKGMPMDQQYSLLVPMHLSIAMGEARMTLRDYPLPVLHVPAIRPGQSPRLPSLSVQSDFVIAEEFRDNQSIRHAQVVVVPPEKDAEGNLYGGLQVDVRRTVSAVKTYSDIAIEVNTSLPTRITWGTSYQPAIQDMMQVIENFTKPPVDPSERVGFWDKIRLTFHSSMSIAWKGDGDVHFVLKGTRDPYLVTGSGAGFVMCWRSDVRWNIGQDPDPRKFMTVDSGEYVLAVPDFSHYARRYFESDNGEDGSSVHSSSSYAEGGKFKKTVMKLSGNVRWLAGLVFERNTSSGGRSFDFKPHYEVVLKNRKYAKIIKGKPWDAYRGFRSHHIHLSVAIAAPHNRDWTVTNLKPSMNYNSVHLTPRLFTHFFDWWSMFSGAMSLPIRQGKLFPGVEKSSKKFGRHLATIKYSLLLSPLYLSHMYKHKDPEEYGQSFVSATGIKLKLDSFMLDLHQRREEFRTFIYGTQGGQGTGRTTTTTAMRINQAQLDFISADVRAVSARISGTNAADIDDATDETLAAFEQSVPKADLSCFTIPDNDTGWVDMDDFVELDWILPAESNPETKILALAFAPRFTYFRNTDHHNVISGDPNRSSPFGNEPTHFCVMSQRNDPRRVQCDLIQERLDRIAEQLARNQRTLGEHELKAIQEVQGEGEMKSRFEAWQNHHQVLLRKQKFLQSMHKTMLSRLDDSDRRGEQDQDAYYEAHEEYDPTDPEVLGMDSAPLVDDISDFNNRFIIHNVQLKWNNSLRDIILRYIHQVSQRRGFVYYMSRRAVKFILDIVDEQKKTKDSKPGSAEQRRSEPATPVSPEDSDQVVQDRIAQMLADGRQFVEADDPDVSSPNGDKKSAAGGPDEEISRDFTAQNAYHVRLVAPQIQMQSEKNTKSAVLVTAKSIQLKVIQIMDKDRLTDEISGLVQRRFTAGMDSVQVYVTSSQTFSSEFLDMYSANRYGAKAGSSWPPWVPLEVMFEPNIDPYGFSRVVERTSARMRFDKFNTLRLKYNDDVTSGQSNPSGGPDHGENRIDHLWVNFPQLHAICDSVQYYALYVMVLDLLLYSEPLEKTRNEKLEKIMLASDFSDLSGAPEMVIKLQEKIKTLLEIKMLFQVNERTLSRQQWKERILLEQDLATCENELFFIMKAITTSQRRYDERAQARASQSTGLLHWEIFAKELVWHLLRGADEHLVELQLRNAVYNRIDNSDGSNDNTMEIGGILGFNLLPNATYFQIIAPLNETPKDAKGKGKDENEVEQPLDDSGKQILRVHWFMLEAIAGIPVMERFEVNIHPLRIQLEREVGMKVFEYIFPGMASNDGDGIDSSPFLVKHMLPSTQEEDEDGAGEDSPTGSVHTMGDSGLLIPVDNPFGAGDLQLRLQPTMTLPVSKRPRAEGKAKGTDNQGRPSDLTRLCHFTKDSSADLRKWTGRSKKGGGLLEVPEPQRPGLSRTNTAGSAMSTATEKDSDTRRRFMIHRTNSGGSKMTSRQHGGRSDDLNEMLSRASKYMTIAYVKIPSMVLCLSYKGKGQRNIVTDVHNLVFRMPTLEYRNKTWSNLDLVLQLKKEVIRALVSHAPAIVGNKFSHLRPKQLQQGRLRDLANNSILLGSSMSTHDGASSTVTASDTTSSRHESMGEDYSDVEERPSFTSGRAESEWSQYDGSIHSSLHSANGHGNGNGNGNGSMQDSPSQITPPALQPRPRTSGGGPSSVPRVTKQRSGSFTALTGHSPSIAESDRDGTSIRESINRRWNSISLHGAAKDNISAAEDNEDGGRRKSKLLMPKFLQSK
ncbi:hypothetical protein EJ08DRAFT_703089 [Tothia fuscella]|uniref:Uncharacterized protein n=1 Tax=Tothia fuscella TaxID=1048955 RepID=A0A9P4NF61_9PEZI|nr:hypothetical protein EJ08DRAFT_703089 [Tothia fuscella]